MTERKVCRRLKKLWNFLSINRKKELLFLLLLMMVVSIFEVVSIGSIIPFIGVLTNIDQFASTELAMMLMNIFSLRASSDLLILCSVLFGLAAIINGLLRIILLRANTKISFGIAADLSNEIFSKSLYQPYVIQIARNSSHLVDAVANKTNGVVYGVLMPTLILASTGMMVAFILTGLVFIQPEATIGSFIVFSLLYLLVIKLNRKNLSADSISVSQESSRIIKLLHEGFGGIRDILINQTQEIYCAEYKESDKRLRDAQARIYFIGNSPRFIMETLGLIFITFLAFYVSKSSDEVIGAMAVLAALAFSAQRLLPMLQQAYLAWSGIRASEASLEEILNLLSQKIAVQKQNSTVIDFTEHIELRDVSFRYSDTQREIFSGINVRINKGDRVGIVGETGSGKSTLVDLIMGLVEPTVGTLSIDGKNVTSLNCNAWFSHIAHVPQDIFLVDKTIVENIALGVPIHETNMHRVRQAASSARLSEAIAQMPLGYDTIVGERGVKLSGGQRQRIAIARAFYRSANLIIFDEGTSALDTGTEDEVMESINEMGSDITVIMIAHRLSTLKNCNKLLTVSEGMVIANE